jgi:hypothetical protein
MSSQARLWRRAALAACVLLAALLPLAIPAVVVPQKAFAAVKTVFIPDRWRTTGEVPWAQERTRESNNFILLWGEKSGTNPLSAPAEFRFDPADILSQLESLYSFYVNTMQFTPETGLLAQHKIIVIITRTWNRTALDAWATGGSTDNRVGVINIAPAAAAPGSWGLAHELGHVFQNYTFLGRSGMGLTHASAGSFWETSAEFMAMQVYPNGGAGDLTRWLRTENLYYSSSRHHYGNWMLAQYIKDRDGIGMFNRIWNEARNTEHPLEVYRRITGITQAELNRRLGEFAQHNVAWDYSNRANFMPFIQNVYGAGFLNAYKGVPVEAVNASLRHYRISDAMAPSDYGYNKVQLVPDSDGALVRLHLKGHAETGANGWTFGFVAVRNGVPRYGPLTTSNDGQISFQTQPGESQVFLVVMGTPTAVPKYAFLDGWAKNRRYPYEFRISGAIPDGHQPGYVKPAPVGGRWHANGGGWVANGANVSASAYVGPRAAVFRGGQRQRPHRGSRLGQRRHGHRQRHRAPQRDRPGRGDHRRQRHHRRRLRATGRSDRCQLHHRHLPDVQPEPGLQRRQHRGRHQPVARHLQQRRAGHHRRHKPVALTLTVALTLFSGYGDQSGPVGHGLMLVHVLVGELRGGQQR